jgi:DNA-directed RNA polymerase specialized sigma24 family protein
MNARSLAEQESLADMSQEELLDLWKRLRLFTHKHYGWLTRKIGGLDLDEVITDAIEDTFLGKRRWPPVDAQGQDKQIPLFTFLCQIIRSKISHIIKREKKMRSIDSDEELESLNQNELHTLRAHEQTDEQARYNELSDDLRKAVKPDPILEQIVELLVIKPDMKPNDIAENLKITDGILHNAQKRLTRKVKDLKAKWSNDYER